AAAGMGEPSGWPPGPRARVCVQGLERRRRRRVGRALLHRIVVGRDALRPDRPRGVLRLPGHAPEDLDHRGPHAGDLLARGRGLRRAHPARAPRPHPAERQRAEHALADVLPAHHRPRRGARDADGRLARRAARRRAALAPGVDHRPVERPGARRATGPPARDLRGPDRDRRRAPRRVPPRRPAQRQPVGERAALRRRGTQPEGGARARAQARAARRRLGRRGRARVRRSRLRASGRPRGPERPRRAGLRRAPRAGGRGGGAVERRRPRRPPVGRRARSRVPALPAPARLRAAPL
ncbi:MAG: hypothetical protein AVDCRST_MAG85-657, partial [uncultured Solirubrobacteraceae bacterium]